MSTNASESVASVPPLFPLPATTAPHTHQKNGLREAVETVVFVTVLVLLLKTFVAEAFVIPTGSMAETLLGYRRFVTCPSCGHHYPVNCSEEVEPQRGGREDVTGSTCPNCRYHDVWKDGPEWIKKPVMWGSGDRVLVAKWPMQNYSRWDVVVFKFPKDPQQNWIPMNYIKRLVGLPGDTIAINNGDLYKSRDIDYKVQEQPGRELDRWWKSYTWPNADTAREGFRLGQFEILRKPPATMLAVRRLVYDNDQQPTDLPESVPPRWQGEAGWADENRRRFRRTEDATGDSWLRYRNIVVAHGNRQPAPAAPFEPSLIRNFMGYNFADTSRIGRGDEDRYWVGDLMLECEVDVTAATGEFVMELSKGLNRFQARFDLSTGVCRLIRKGVSDEELGNTVTTLRGAGKQTVRFANFDDRLTVWVGRQLPFGDGVDYAGDRSGRSNDANDLQPASVGATGGARLTVGNLKLFRDTYYTAAGGGPIVKAEGEPDMTLFVQPGHYLCMGDNSTQSSDGREWGTVPERLMLGRALVVYFPFWPWAPRFGPIR